MSNRSRPFVHRLLDFRPSSPHGVIRLLLLSAATPYSTAQSSTGPPQNPYGADGGIGQPMALVVVIFVCFLFLIAFFSICIRQCSEDTAAQNSRRFSSASAAAGRGRLRLSPRGLDPSVIESLPIFVYSAVKDLTIGKGALQCAVCISEFEEDETLRLLPKCDHVFHTECIDAWLASHSTCPVCRAYLKPSPGELAKVTARRTESNDSPEEQNSRPELSEVQNQVSIDVDEEQKRDSQVNEIVNTSQTNWRRVVEKFPRSHSTGHSLVQPGDSSESYTLRLPEEVRRQIVIDQRLKRTTRSVRETSSLRGYRSGGEGSSPWRQVGSSDRWVFIVTPPFLWRTGVTSSKVGDGDLSAPEIPKMYLTSVNSPSDCLAGTSDEVHQLSTRPPI